MSDERKVWCLVRFGILGPLMICAADGSEVAIDGPRQAKVLAALLIDANEWVSVSSLSYAVWDADQPATAVRQVQDAVSVLRRRLQPLQTPGAPESLFERRGQAYRINVTADRLDLLTFTEHFDRARRLAQTSDTLATATALRTALACWRGPALNGLPGDALGAVAAQLDAHRYTAQLQLFGLELAANRHHAILDQAAALVAEHPFDEQLARCRMLALHGSGRRAEALAVYRDLRRTLMAELGLEPGTDLRRVHEQILADDPALNSTTPAGSRLPASIPAPAAPTPRTNGPRQLPADTGAFTGRTEEVARLTALAEETISGRPGYGTVVISAIDGMAGIGKTALAVHVAQRIAEQFTDGQLFLDLQGYDPQSPPMPAISALGSLLRSLSVPAARIPESESDRAALLRDRLAGTRTLLLLDNAADAAQVRPLIPGTPGCLVLVTSRRRLTGLDDAEPVNLNTLPEADAVALLHKIAGSGRIPDGDPSAVELVRLCGCIPLAIRITAARLRHRPTLTLDLLVEQLRDEHARLASLTDQDRSLSAAFDTSFAPLTVAEKRLFRLLGVVPGQDFEPYAAANLLDTDRQSAQRLLEALLDHNLLLQQSANRFRFHDLVRAYARTLLASEAVAEDESALNRLLDYYEHTAHTADDKLDAQARPSRPGAPALPRAQPQLTDFAGSMAWLRAERENITAAIAHARATGRDTRAVTLTEALSLLLGIDGPPSAAFALNQSAADLARELGDQVGEAEALFKMGIAKTSLGDYAAAIALQQRSLSLSEAVGEPAGLARPLVQLAFLTREESDFPAALAYARRALKVAQALGDRPGQATALRLVGRSYAPIDLREAVEAYRAALRIFQELEHRLGESRLKWDLGVVLGWAGRHQEATALLEEAGNAFEAAGYRFRHAVVLMELGHVRRAQNRHEAAMTLYEHSHTIFKEIAEGPGEAHARFAIGLGRQSTGEHAAAAELIASALVDFQAMGRSESIGEALVALSRSRRALGDLAAAHEAMGKALALYDMAGHRYGQAWALAEAGALAAQADDPKAALEYFRQALAIASEVGAPPCEAACLHGIAGCLDALGDRVAARAAREQAQEIHHTMSVPAAAREALR